ncbi:hypothetical protein [Novosphingobium sp.]|uniref:hypothetical protein n=1 Tax=Novosphingobium sp. TaxID=1874826 RepID=UPI0025E0DA21|nr:hypothetical protein [Novosphingobium sp.]
MRPEVIELQHYAEEHGAQFHVVPRARSLLGLVTANDELIVLGDGLFVTPCAAAVLLEQGQAVLVQPIDQGLAAGFERIDLNCASAAAMRIPGSMIEAVADLPEDCDAASALQRVALQGGVRQRAIPAVDQGKVFWSLLRTDTEAHQLEPQWIRLRTSDDVPPNPSRFLALIFVRRLGPSLLHAGSGAAHVAIGAAMLAAIALAAGWLGFFATGLIFCALGWLCREASGLLARVETGISRTRLQVLGQVHSYGWTIDAIIIVLLGWGAPAHPWQHLSDRFFPAFMLIAVLRLLPRVIEKRWTAWLDDRALLALTLSAALASGLGSIAIHSAAVIASLAGIVLPGLTKRLTRT